MRTPLEGSAARDGRFLILQAEPCAVGFRARSVARLVAESDWNGAPPLELARALRLEITVEAAPRVLWVQAGQRGFPVLVRGALQLTTVTSEGVVALPDWLCAAHCFREVLLREGHADALIIDPERLARSLPLPSGTLQEGSAS